MLRPEQASQVNRQIEAYENNPETKTLNIRLGESTFELEVDPFVASPDIMNSGRQMVDFLSNRPELVAGKTITDMGTGSGIIGIAAALLEAKLVLMADIDEAAVHNAFRNTQKLNLKNCETFQSDLFEKFHGRPKADVQIFNHPFFSAEKIPNKDWTRMMLGGTELIGRYFEQAPDYSTPEATYILPWLTLADNETIDNNPGKRALAYGYEVINVTEQEPTVQGLQKALFKIYELRKR